MIYTDFKLINLPLPKLVICIFIITILLISSISLSVSADNTAVSADIIEVMTDESGTDISKLYITTVIYNENISDLNGYICVYGRDNRLKSVAIANAQIGENRTISKIIGSFNTKEDYIKLLVWDNNMIPYSVGKATPLYNIYRKISSPSAPGRGGDSVNSPNSTNQKGGSEWRTSHYRSAGKINKTKNVNYPLLAKYPYALISM